MKYLFFDIECSNCFDGIGKMCEFGYVLTDEHFNILKMNDFPMSPGKGAINRFHLRDRMKQEDVALAYEEDYYFSCEEFPYFYESIKRLVCDKDTVCFAYSADNDIMHLYNSCKRYGKEPFDYICYDVQKIADVYLESENQTNLKKAYIEIVGPNKVLAYQEHLSRDDARMTADIFEAICILEQKSPKDLLSESGFGRFNSIEFVNSFLNKSQTKKKRAEAHDLYKKICDGNFEKAKMQEYIGRRVNISGALKTDPESVLEIIKKIEEKGNIPVNAISLTDIFIVCDDKGRKKIAKDVMEHFTGQVFTIDEFLGN